ncbi:protein ABHD11 [Diorhabda sublineata]|nr:protein ABHD11 [Diorhabda sublineata]
MHGLLGSKNNWLAKCKQYSKKTKPPRQIIAIDSRNHGKSPHTNIHTYEHIVADMKALFDRISLTKVALLGHSMGGRSCMLYSLKYPELVEKLIVADISPITGLHMAEFAKIFDILLAAQIPSGVPVSKAVKMMDNDLTPKIASSRLRNFLLSNIVKKQDGSNGWRVNLTVLAKDLKHLCVFPLDDTMRYEGPTLFVAGGNSNFVPKSDLPKILKYFPKAELTYIKGATHWLHLDKPQEFMDITVEFLNRS